MEGRGGSAHVIGQTGEVNLTTSCCSSLATLEQSQSVFSRGNECLFRAKERNGVLMAVFHYSPKIKMPQECQDELKKQFGE